MESVFKISNQNISRKFFLLFLYSKREMSPISISNLYSVSVFYTTFFFKVENLTQSLRITFIFILLSNLISILKFQTFFFLFIKTHILELFSKCFTILIILYKKLFKLKLSIFFHFFLFFYIRKNNFQIITENFCLSIPYFIYSRRNYISIYLYKTIISITNYKQNM